MSDDRIDPARPDTSGEVPGNQSAPVHPATFVCSKCGVEKPWGEKRKGGHRTCRLCMKSYNAAYYAANRDRMIAYDRATRHLTRERDALYNKRWHEANPGRGKLYKLRYTLKAKYRLTIEDRDAMLAAQGGKCASCMNPIMFTGSSNGAHVDHCHETGLVRAILCHRCNVALGGAGESPARLRALAVYAKWCEEIKRTHQKPKEA